MATKLRDLAVKTGEYQNQQGETKGQWQNVGALMKGDDGNEFIILKRWFNPAGLPNPNDRDSVIVSCFKSENAGQGQQSAQPQQQPAQQAPAPQKGADNYSDDIPF